MLVLILINKIYTSMTVKDRLKAYLGAKHITQNAFSHTIGVSKAYVTNMRKSLSPDVITNITKHFPDLNIQWLLTGQGSMLNDEKLSPSPITAENAIVGDGNNNNSIQSADDSFWKDLVNNLQATISDLRSRCGDFERQNQELQKLLDEERERNKQFPIRFID